MQLFCCKNRVLTAEDAEGRREILATALRLSASSAVDFLQNHERPACKQTDLSVVVGMTGFEPAAPRPPGVCATGLRHIPLLSSVVDTGFEPVTSAMSMQRSKPTELIDRLADVSGCKYTTPGQSAKVPPHYFTATLGLGRGGEAGRGEVRSVVGAAVLGDRTELPFVLLYVIGKGS